MTRSVFAVLRSERRLPALLLAFACTFAFFLERPAWNQNSRLALTRAVVERGALSIDDSHHTTGDKSFRDGSHYSDKAPGASFLAAPAYAAFAGMRRAMDLSMPEVTVAPLDPLDGLTGRVPSLDALKPGDTLSYNPAHHIALSICALASSGLLTLLGLLALYVAAVYLADERVPGRTSAAGSRAVEEDAWRPSADARRLGILACIIYGLCTPALAYAGAFYGHQPSAGALFFAWVVVQFSRGGPRWAAPLAVGSSCGLAVVCEYPSAIPVVLLLAYAAWLRGPRFMIAAGLAGIPWAAALAAYHTAAFGHPFSLGYDHLVRSEFADGMAVQYGIGWPKFDALWAITFGNSRGLFYASPVLLVCAYGCVAAIRRRPRGERPLWCFVTTTCAYYLCLNAGYYMWNGGAAFGPRHCLPMLPFLVCGFVHVARRMPGVVLALASLSLLHSIAGASAGPELPEYDDPIWGHAIPSISRAGLGAAYNSPQTLGNLLGLQGWFGLLPLAALWILLAPWRSPALSTREKVPE